MSKFITPRVLQAVGASAEEAERLVEPMRAACALFAIDTRQRVAAFIGQCAHESAGFTRMEENLRYTTPKRIMQMFSRVRTLEQAQALVAKPEALANVVYASRLGNGPQATGDGWRYRGRGLIQLTGREIYRRAANDLARPYEDQPDLVAQPSDACLTAAWFWFGNGLNSKADMGDTRAITRAINGPAMAGLHERVVLCNLANMAIQEI